MLKSAVFATLSKKCVAYLFVKWEKIVKIVRFLRCNFAIIYIILIF